MKKVTLSGREHVVENLVQPVGYDSDQRLNIQIHSAGTVSQTEAGFLKPAVFVLTPHYFFDECSKARLQNVQSLRDSLIIRRHDKISGADNLNAHSFRIFDMKSRVKVVFRIRAAFFEFPCH